jgi:hypothetical protein
MKYALSLLGVVCLTTRSIDLTNLSRRGHLRLADSEGARSSAHFSRLKAIQRATEKTKSVPPIDGLDTYYMYDASAKKAASDLSTWLYERNIPLPLFPNRLGADSSQLNASKPPGICISIVSTRRLSSPVSYITQTVLSLLTRMDYFKHQDDVYIHVFNVDSDPDGHTDLDMIRGIVPITNVKVPFDREIGNLTIRPQHHENLDNAFIMRKMMSIGCEHPIFLEDDTIADENWYDLMQIAFDQLGRRESDWFAVRLYSARSYYPPLDHRGLTDYDPRFNAVAVLVNPKHIEDYAKGLEDAVSYAISKRDEKILLPKDIVLDGCARRELAPILSFEPVIFQHVGLFSSVRQSVVDKAYANFWILFSKYFESDGEPIIFDEQRWIQ